MSWSVPLFCCCRILQKGQLICTLVFPGFPDLYPCFACENTSVLRSGFWGKPRVQINSTEMILDQVFKEKQGYRSPHLFNPYFGAKKHLLFLPSGPKRNWSVPCFFQDFLICTPVLWIDLYPWFSMGSWIRQPSDRGGIPCQKKKKQKEKYGRNSRPARDNVTSSASRRFPSSWKSPKWPKKVGFWGVHFLMIFWVPKKLFFWTCLSIWTGSALYF